MIEEDCEYSGELIFKSPPGSIVSSRRCEELCLDFQFVNCMYWSYVGNQKTCYLYDSTERICQTIGGPESPAIEECSGRYFWYNHLCKLFPLICIYIYIYIL